ncbi:MAG TPA: polymer-forming cytoskeletal protein [Spirochaetales bacterium]|nr:polymer-forming cytoskeletal protein [Spirochaetales bacterium]MBP7264179.1 polymer-forming cytoskeletal protein [Spirochaetia bacterium]HPE36252.1 polymer-forming cytoskeletal protein [Spirochaetales bacterium]
MNEVPLSFVDEDTLDTILAEDVSFTGTLSFKEPLMIKGRVSGSIRTESDLHIDEKAVVEADINAANVTVRGLVKGNIVATGRVELFSSCTVNGDVRAAQVTMEPGCRFNGVCTMTGARDAGQA